MDTLPLDQQKKAILYAPKDLLWAILDEDEGWLKLFSVLPQEYYTQFLGRLRTVGALTDDQIRTMAKIYVRNKVRLDHLQEAIALVWKPTDLEDATSWLKEKGFLDRPLMPLNLQAQATETELSPADMRRSVEAAASMPEATRMRLARRAAGEGPKVSKPPEGASKEATRLWNKLFRNEKTRKTIYTPKGVSDQWALAVSLWLRECQKADIQAYKSESESSSAHAENSLQRSVQELHNALCYDGYTMSRPASRMLKKLYDQLEKDGYSLGDWTTIRPKKSKRP